MFASPEGSALTGNSMTVDADMFLFKVQCTGEVRLPGAHIAGQLNCAEAAFTNPDGLAVDLEQASVVKEVHMRPASLNGALDLARARVGAWHDEKKTWPKRISLDGFVYDRIEAPDASIKDRLRSWLPRNSYLPQPYEQLAGIYRREGHEQAARYYSRTLS
jgi:hypothetical protein